MGKSLLNVTRLWKFWGIRRFLLLFLVLSLTLVMNFPVVAADSLATQGTATETIWLDSYDPDSKHEGEPPVLLIFPEAEGVLNLDVGAYYWVNVQGTWSAWTHEMWETHTSPDTTPELLPIFESPATYNGKVGLDAEYAFAWETGWRPEGTNPPVRLPRVKLSLDGGISWSYYTPINEQYNPSHSYTYKVAGQGYPLKARLIDNGYDDYGQFRIEIIQVSPSEQIEIIEDEFDDAVLTGDLVGEGPGNSAGGKLKALRNMLERAEELIDQEKIDEAIQQLEDAYKRVDGNPKPPDFATGAKAEAMAAMILNLIENLRDL